MPQRAREPTFRGGRNMNSVTRARYYIRAVEDFLHDTIQLRYAFLSLDAISRRNPISGDSGFVQHVAPMFRLLAMIAVVLYGFVQIVIGFCNASLAVVIGAQARSAYKYKKSG